MIDFACGICRCSAHHVGMERRSVDVAAASTRMPQNVDIANRSVASGPPS